METMDRAWSPNDTAVDKTGLHNTEMTYLIRVVYGVFPRPLCHIDLASLHEYVLRDDWIGRQCSRIVSGGFIVLLGLRCDVTEVLQLFSATLLEV